MARFEPFLTLTLKHPYYRDGIMQDFVIYATNPADKELSRSQILIKTFGNQIIFLQQAGEEKLSCEEGLLGFYLCGYDRNIINATDFPSDKRDSIFHVVINDNVSPKIDPKDGPFRSKNIKELSYITSQAIIIAFIEINIKKFQDAKSPGSVEITFPARSTLWRYLIPSMLTKNDEKYSVDHTDQEETTKGLNQNISFSLVNSEDNLGEELKKFKIFQSNQEILIQESYSYKFTLWREKDAKKVALLNRLGGAPAENITYMSGKYYSNIFLHF